MPMNSEKTPVVVGVNLYCRLQKPPGLRVDPQLLAVVVKSAVLPVGAATLMVTVAEVELVRYGSEGCRGSAGGLAGRSYALRW